MTVRKKSKVVDRTLQYKQSMDEQGLGQSGPAPGQRIVNKRTPGCDPDLWIQQGIAAKLAFKTAGSRVQVSVTAEEIVLWQDPLPDGRE